MSSESENPRTLGGDNLQDNDYVNRPGDNGEVPVVKDSENVESGLSGNQDSDEQLARDDTDAIDESNIIDSRTRGAGPQGSYREPGDEEGLPTDDGTSGVAQDGTKS